MTHPQNEYDGSFSTGGDGSFETAVSTSPRDESAAHPELSRVILIRHGQTHANIRKILDTQLPGAPLTDEGVAQARRLGRVLLPSWGRMSEVVTSHALRARQTGAGAVAGLHRLAGPGVRLRHMDGLHEVNAGDWEGRSDFEAHRQFLDVFRSWSHGDIDRSTPNGESALDVLERYLPALETLVENNIVSPLLAGNSADTSGVAGGDSTDTEVAQADDAQNVEGRDVAVVTHGAVMRVVAAHLTGLSGEFIVHNPLANASRVEIARTIQPADAHRASNLVVPGEWKLVRWGELVGSALEQELGRY